MLMIRLEALTRLRSQDIGQSIACLKFLVVLEMKQRTILRKLGHIRFICKPPRLCCVRGSGTVNFA